MVVSCSARAAGQSPKAAARREGQLAQDPMSSQSHLPHNCRQQLAVQRSHIAACDHALEVSDQRTETCTTTISCQSREQTPTIQCDVVPAHSSDAAGGGRATCLTDGSPAHIYSQVAAHDVSHGAGQGRPLCG